MGSIGWGPKRIQSEVSASHYNDGRAKSHVGFVNPVHFLHATTPDDQRLNHIVDQAGQLDKEKLSKEVQSPFFEVRDGKIVSHEGRHRMSALARQGYTSVPVTIHHGKGSNLDPADSVTLQPQFKGRDPVTVSNLVPLHHDYDDQINDMMKQQPEHFQDGGDVDGINNFVDDHSSAIAGAMQNHFGVPVSVSKSKTAYGKSHYVKPNFDLPESETPFVVRVSDHAAWVPRLHQVEHHVYPKKTDDPRKFIGESIEAATAYGKRRGLFPKDEFVPLSGKVVHPTFGEGTVLDSKPDVAKVDFGKNGVKNISARFLQPIHKADGGDVDGITAYHGSPHDFDEFDTSKIGTGEGSQSFGHGLYFAQAEPVAEGYRDKLSGRNIDYNNPAELAASIVKITGSHEAALEHLKTLPPEWHYPAHKEAIDFLEQKKELPNPVGHMYEVHINAHPHHMLDWDKPLSEQPSYITKSLFDVRKELPTLWEKTQHHINNDSTAGDFYQSIAAGHPHGYAGATEQLSRAGIKGIKYLDAGSRGKDDKSTHNYVVFDHNDVHIKRKYEQGGRVGFDDGGSVHDKFLPHNHPQRQQNLGEFLKESAVKHPDGRPKVVYHNTNRSFNEFRTAKSEMGAHFGTPAQANDILESTLDRHDHQGYPVYLNLKNPLRLRDTGTFDTYRIHRQLKEMGLAEGLPKNPHQLEMQEHLQSLGYDGVVYLNRREGISRAKGKDPERYNDYSDQMFKHHFPDAEDSYIAFDPTQIKSAIGNNGYYDQNEPDITKAEGGDVWDDSRVRRSGEGGAETALDFIQNAPLYKQRMEAQAPQPAPVVAPSTEAKSMPVTAGPPPTPPAIVQPAQPIQQKQEAPQAQGQVGLYAVGTNDPNPDMTVQSAQRIIESSRAMGINPVFLLPNQAGGTQYAKNSKALQDYLDSVGIQYQMPQYGDKDPLHMTPGWASGAAKSYQAPFLAGDSNSVRLGIVGYGAKGDGKTIVHPESGAVLGRVGANSKAVADELERHLEWNRRNRTERNTGGPVNASKGQDTAGNFKKEHEKIHGVPVAIEVKEGHDRVKYEPDGSLKFKAKQYADYGAILGTKDADGMNTDVMVGPHKDSDKAYIIDQRKHSTGKFDEHKVMLGFNKRKKAIKAYTKSYADRHGKDRVQDVIKTDIAGLKRWLKRGDLKKSAAKDALINRALEVVSKKT